MSGGEAKTVADYFEAWIATRLARQAALKMSTARDEETRIRRHALPLLARIELAEVAPRHIRVLMDHLETSDLAPRTQLHVYRTLRTMFQRALRDELILRNPCCLGREELPKKVDADPGWRAMAVFELDEVERMLVAKTIPLDRRSLYGLLFLGGLRLGEALALRWEHIIQREPLDMIALSRAWCARLGVERAPKSKVGREIPVHPTLGQLLLELREPGWAQLFGRPPSSRDLVVPRTPGRSASRPDRVRHPNVARKQFKSDLARLGLRERSPHDARATFISLTVEAGCAPQLMERITHAPLEQTARDGYLRPSWAAICRELLKLRLGPRRGGHLRVV